jgi:dipeptidyl aminopeptidase/acylaminoacyl peptidase
VNEEKNLKPIQPEDLFELELLQGGCFSPDGKTVAYTVSFTDKEKDEDMAAIWLQSLETGEKRQLTAGTAYDSNPQWSPDGKQIAFRSTRGDKAQIYLTAVGGGEAMALTSMPQGVGNDLAWSPDGKSIAFNAGPAQPAFNPHLPYRITRAMYRLDGMGYVDNAVNDIYIIPATGGDPTQLTDDACHNFMPFWSPDSQEIAYHVILFPDSYRFFPALRVVNLAGEVREVVESWGFAHTAAWTPDGNRIVFVGNRNEVPFGTQDKLWIVDREGGEPECRTPTCPLDVGGELQPDIPIIGLQPPYVFVTGDGRFAYTRVQDGGAMHTYRIALTGDEFWEPVIAGEWRSAAPAGIDVNHLLFMTVSLTDPTQLHVADLDGGNERQLTRLNTDFLATRKMPMVEHLAFTGEDGTPVEGWFMKPVNGQAPYPTILYIHGGPHQGWGHMFNFDAQMLAGAGYGVLLINYRGTSGYGDEFSTMINGDLGRLEYADLMAGVDYGIEQGLVDESRMGVAGLSNGGYLTCWIVGHTDRFKAAVPENPIINQLSWYGVCDLGPSFPETTAGHPHESPDVFSRVSPITYAHRCTTPTLLIQSEHDWRCPAEQSEQFYTVLKINGCVVEMLRFPYMPHMASIGGPPYIRRAQNEALLDWMQRYV